MGVGQDVCRWWRGGEVVGVGVGVLLRCGALWMGDTCHKKVW